MRKDNRLIDRITLEDGTTLQIWRGAYADELTVKLASSCEELPFLRVACPHFINVIVLASGPYAELLGIQKTPDGGFAARTNRGHHHIKRTASGEWVSKYVGQVPIKWSGGRHMQPT